MLSGLLAAPAWAQDGGEGVETAEVEEGPKARKAKRRADKPAPNVSATFSNDFELRYWQIPDRLEGFEDQPVLDYIEAVNRFTSNVRTGPFSAFLQVDQVHLFMNTYLLDDVRYLDRPLMQPGTTSYLVPGAYDPGTNTLQGWDLASANAFINLEKIRLSYQRGDLSLSFGDVYAAFGRGAALNLNRNVDIDIDTSIQGVKMLWRPGLWDIQMVAGQLNRQQVFQDNPNIGIFDDRRHSMGGVRIERYGLGPANVGAHGVLWNFTTEEGLEAAFDNLDTAPDVAVVGGNVELLGLGPTDWYVEANGYLFPTDDTFGGEPATPGYGLYASGAAYAGIATFLLEFKRYYQTQRVNGLLAPELYQAAIAPTLEYERAITEDSAATLGSNDLWGTRLRVDFTAIPGALVPYTSLAVYRDEEQGPLHFNRSPEWVFHPMAGVEYTQGAWSVLANAGYRHDRRDDEADGADQQLHGDVLARLPIAKGFSFDLSVGLEWYQWGNNPVQQTDYVEMESSFALQYKNWLTLIWYTDYSTNPLIDSTGNLSDAVYGAGEIQIKPTSTVTIRAFYGAYKSGIRCSGGQCRVLPGFQGGRVAVTATF